METRAEVFRRWKRGLLVIGAIYAFAFLGAFGWFQYRVSAHSRWHRQVELLILKLTPMRPADVTPDQWAQCLQNTWNLHQNYGDWTSFPEDHRQPFVDNFERHLAAPVTLGTIDQIWSDYVRHAPRAKGYMRFLPTTPQMLSAAGDIPNDSLSSSLAWFEDELTRRERDP